MRFEDETSEEKALIDTFSSMSSNVLYQLATEAGPLHPAHLYIKESGLVTCFVRLKDNKVKTQFTYEVGKLDSQIGLTPCKRGIRVILENE